MADTPNEAPAAPAESVATPNNNSTEPQGDAQTQAPSQPDMHGFTSEQLADMRKFFDNNGGFDAIKSKISNPAPAQDPVKDVEPKTTEPAQPAEQKQPEFKAPAGAINQNEYFVKRHFMDFAGEEQYANIAKEITSGKVLTEMADLGVQYMLPNGAIDTEKVNKFLTMKSQTVPAKQSQAEPEASAAPTVDYIPVGEKIMDMNQAMQVIRQDTQLKNQGLAGHPSIKLAEEFMKQALNKKEK